MNVATAPASAQYNFSAPSEVSALAKLPKSAIDKFEKLRALEIRANALRSGLYEAYQTARENFGNAQRDLLNFDKRYGATVTVVREGKRIEEEQSGRAPLREQVERLKAEVDRLRAEQASTNIGFNTSDIIGFLSSTNATFVAVPSPKVVVEKGQSLSDSLAQIRARQSEVRDEIVDTENAPLPPAEAKEAMRKQLAAIAENGQPDISGLTHGLPVAFPTELLTASGHVPNAVTVAANVKNAFAFSVWLHQETLVRRLSEAIDAAAEATDAVPLNAIDRGAKLIALNKSLTSLLRSEEATIMKIEESGGAVQRTCRDPMILLGIEMKI
jgi:hypothetical protein